MRVRNICFSFLAIDPSCLLYFFILVYLGISCEKYVNLYLSRNLSNMEKSLSEILLITKVFCLNVPSFRLLSTLVFKDWKEKNLFD